MKKRMITATILVCLSVPAIIVPELVTVFEFLLIFGAIMATLEMLNMYGAKGHVYSTKIKVMAVIFTILLYFAIVNLSVEYFRFEADELKEISTNLEHSLIRKLLEAIHLENFITPITVLTAVFIILMTVMTFSKELEVSDVGRILTAIVYVGVCTGSLTMLRHLGVRFVIFLLGITSFTDTFALVFGMALGKHKMAPTISPKKTWEGAIGGTAVATVLGFLIIFLYPHFSSFFHNGRVIEFFDGVFGYANFSTVGKVLFAIVLSASISICSQIGDLVASKFKRNYGIKDYSQIFPGHGGVLDRFDSAFFASSIFIIFIICETKLYAPIIPNFNLNSLMTFIKGI